MEKLLMNWRERCRLEIFSRVKQGIINVVEVGRFLAISERQARRIWKLSKQDGTWVLCTLCAERKAMRARRRYGRRRRRQARSAAWRIAALARPCATQACLRPKGVTFLLKQYKWGRNNVTVHGPDGSNEGVGRPEK